MNTTIELSKRLFEIPTSPFHEKYVLREIQSILIENKIPYFFDSTGNLIAGAASAKKIPATGVAYVAHTDHPGFYFTLNKNSISAMGMWMGGGPLSQMVGAKLSIHNFNDPHTKYIGVVTYFKKGNHRDGISFKLKFKKSLPPGDYFGAFDFPGFKLRNGKVITKAADDLAGCVMALGALVDLKQKKNQVIGIFTRAEEVGFAGCWAMLKSKTLPTSLKIISLEASRTLPGALLGEGPVVRLGDASTLYDSKFALFMQKVAHDLKLKDPNFKYQKRIMDGGSCEATAFSLFGFRTMGLAVPLNNYHNMGKKGPAPEEIHSLDLENGRKLLTQLGLQWNAFEKATESLKGRLEDNFKNLEAHLYTHEF